MGNAHVTIELRVDGSSIASVDVPMKLIAGDLTVNGVIPLSADTADLSARIERGIAAFKAAVEK